MCSTPHHKEAAETEADKIEISATLAARIAQVAMIIIGVTGGLSIITIGGQLADQRTAFIALISTVVGTVIVGTIILTGSAVIRVVRAETAHLNQRLDRYDQVAATLTNAAQDDVAKKRASGR